ncbi:isocitrate lyase/PEP mutase family protein [Methylobacterium radiotolerans]|uniref:isocitrate lyase/PEP mutase family protein n=1 Tax=Methylobacterium TaxID=407 RepID=UPI000750D981|nr:MULTISPECIES: isocitrate lyase/phosphoenolpyruvate mutase family protein [Methylobacterium]MBN6819092.1 isocitrate lyase/phosphoenolpyruvate mutase family protein [Methylobacterium organophilum]MDE3744993.1 isocitrate lyase/phosphoenolpyruvate mutase family protein [Methylobacterium radiotolerans]OXE39595.1 isocitrate lyase/phosphoenolpyruvate mutase family protein [Methylobacterium radiotolerans]PVZ06131.1 2-methylisocitrate lyase-like PEP mutase family enzyme [Methylobacterium organophilum
MADLEAKHRVFVALHERPGAFVVANPWDAGSSRILTALGYEALATTSAGFAFAVGRRDSTASLSRDAILENARAIVDATHLPVTADLEDGFGTDPEACALTIARASEIGLVGGSIEDATGDAASPIFDFGHAVERVAAAAEAARRLPFVLTARAENHLCGRPDLDDTIRRLQAFEEAGAHVLYAPNLPDLKAIRAVCAAVSRPVNVVAGLSPRQYTVAELEAAGVKRISVGGSFARAALGGLARAAREVLDRGTFTYAAEAMSGSEARSYMAEATR